MPTALSRPENRASSLSVSPSDWFVERERAYSRSTVDRGPEKALARHAGKNTPYGVMLHSRLLQTKFLRFRSSRQRHNTEVAELSVANYSKSVLDVQSPTVGKSAAVAFLPAQSARSLVPLSYPNRTR